MLSPLTAARLFTWALPAGAISIPGEGARSVGDLLEAWAAGEGKPGSGEAVPSSAAQRGGWVLINSFPCVSCPRASERVLSQP